MTAVRPKGTNRPRDDCRDASFCELRLRLGEPTPGLPEEPTAGVASKRAPHRVGDVVSRRRAGGSRQDDEHERELSGRGEDAGGDERDLSRRGREEDVEQDEEEERAVRPGRRRENAEQRLEHA